MKLGYKVAIGVGAVGVVGAVLFGTPFSRGAFKNYWGVGTMGKSNTSPDHSSPGLSPVGVQVPIVSTTGITVPEYLRGIHVDVQAVHR